MTSDSHSPNDHIPPQKRRLKKSDDARSESTQRLTAEQLSDQAAQRRVFGSASAEFSSQELTVVSEKGGHTKPKKTKKPWFLQRILNEWFNRLIGAASNGGFSEQEEQYAADKTSRDYVWNTAGTATWGMVFPVLTIVVTQLVGVEQAGMFSLAFVVGLLLMFVANYGVRTYQVSDIDENHSFIDYQINRFATCVLMIIAGLIYCSFRGYSEDMFIISMGVYFYKMIDGLADVYEGRLQQVGKLYLAGISQTVRSVLVVIIFSICLLITRNLAASCVVMAVVAAITFLILTLPLALLETPKSRKLNWTCVLALFKQCFPLFLALFLFNLIDSMPKFVMEGVLSYDNQLYFNAMYFPAQAILIAIQLVYKPQLVRMTNLWIDPQKRKKFDLVILAMLVAIAALTTVVILVMSWIGIPILSFLYGIEFEPMRELVYIMLIAGGVTAGIDFLYAVITVLRQQKEVTKLYVITFGFSLFIPALLVNFTGLPGIVIGYLIIMSILFVLLIWEYLRIRFSIPNEVAADVEAAEVVRPRPSELRAERERLKQHRGEGVSKKSSFWKR